MEILILSFIFFVITQILIIISFLVGVNVHNYVRIDEDYLDNEILDIGVISSAELSDEKLEVLLEKVQSHIELSDEDGNRFDYINPNEKLIYIDFSNVEFNIDDDYNEMV